MRVEWDDQWYPVVVKKITRNRYAASVKINHKGVNFDTTVHGSTELEAITKLEKFLNKKVERKAVNP